MTTNQRMRQAAEAIANDMTELREAFRAGHIDQAFYMTEMVALWDTAAARGVARLLRAIR